MHFLGEKVRILEELERDSRSEGPRAMNLMARKGHANDLACCYALHKSLGLPYPEARWRILPAMWRALLSNETMQLLVVEDRSKPISSRIVSFNTAFFVTDEFCSEAQSTLAPYLGVHMARYYSSRELPILNRQQIARANAHDGLSVLMCFGGCEHNSLSGEQFLAVREKQREAFRVALSGYHVKQFLAEPIGEETLQWMLDGGVHLRRDYSNYFLKHGAVFVYTPPRFHFNRSEQVLLRRALMGKTCEDLAASLFISPWTVKKRWHAIYEQVADIDSELLPPSIADGRHATSRGAERRRHLLSYLRQHPEELRPFNG